MKIKTSAILKFLVCLLSLCLSLPPAGTYAHTADTHALAPSSAIPDPDAWARADLQRRYEARKDRLGAGNRKLYENDPGAALAIWESHLQYRQRRLAEGDTSLPTLDEAADDLFVVGKKLPARHPDWKLDLHWHDTKPYYTHPFRDSKKWVESFRKYLDELVQEQDKVGTRELRFLSMGASTGAEAYSIAAMVADVLDAHARSKNILDPREKEAWLDSWDIRIEAMDTALGPLNHAARGRFAVSNHLNEWEGKDKPFAKKYFHVPHFKIVETFQDKKYGKVTIRQASNRLRRWVWPRQADLTDSTDRKRLLEGAVHGVFLNNVDLYLGHEKVLAINEDLVATLSNKEKVYLYQTHHPMLVRSRRTSEKIETQAHWLKEHDPLLRVEMFIEQLLRDESRRLRPIDILSIEELQHALRIGQPTLISRAQRESFYAQAKQFAPPGFPAAFLCGLRLALGLDQPEMPWPQKKSGFKDESSKSSALLSLELNFHEDRQPMEEQHMQTIVDRIVERGGAQTYPVDKDRFVLIADYFAVLFTRQADGTWRAQQHTGSKQKHLWETFVRVLPQLGPGHKELFLENPKALQSVWDSAHAMRDRRLAVGEAEPFNFDALLLETLSADLPLDAKDYERQLEKSFFYRRDEHGAVRNRTLPFREANLWVDAFARQLEERIEEQEKNGRRTLRVLDYGSSTGAEALSIAAIVAHALDRLAETKGLQGTAKEKWLDQWNIRIENVDKSPNALFKAMRGVIVDIKTWRKTEKQYAQRYFTAPYFYRQGDTIRASDRVLRWMQPQLGDMENEEDRKALYGQRADAMLMKRLIHYIRVDKAGAFLNEISKAISLWGNTLVCRNLETALLPSREDVSSIDNIDDRQTFTRGFVCALLREPDLKIRVMKYLQFAYPTPPQSMYFVTEAIARLQGKKVNTRQEREKLMTTLWALSGFQLTLEQIHYLRMLLELDVPVVPQRKRAPVTRSEFLAFSKRFAKDLKREVAAARMRFAPQLSAKELKSFMRHCVEQSLLLELSAKKMAEFLADRPPVTVEQFLKLTRWAYRDLRGEIRKALGEPFYFDADGDLSAELARQLLYEYSQEEILQWPDELQRGAECLLLYNFYHIQTHAATYEQYHISDPDVRHELRLKPRFYYDLFLQTTWDTPLAEQTRAAIQDRPLIERSLVRPSDPSVRRLPGDEKSVPAPTDISLRGLADDLRGRVLEFAANSKLRIQDMRWPDALQSMLDPAPSVLRKEELQGLLKIHTLPRRQVEEIWSKRALAWREDSHHPERFPEPVSAWIRSFSSIPDVRAQKAFPWDYAARDYDDAQQGKYPYLTGLTERLPKAWDRYLKPAQMQKLDDLLHHVFRNAHKPFPSFNSTQHVIWTKEEILDLGRKVPGPGSGAYKLTLLLTALFSHLFDVHPYLREDGSVDVVLDPLFDRVKDETEALTVRRNLELYKHVKQDMDARRAAAIRANTEKVLFKPEAVPPDRQEADGLLAASA